MEDENPFRDSDARPEPGRAEESKELGRTRTQERWENQRTLNMPDKRVIRDAVASGVHRGLWRYTRHPNYFGNASVCGGP